MKPQRFVCAAVMLLLIHIAAANSHALIPEPDNIIYGRARIGGIPLNATHTDKTITLEVAGNPIAAYTMGANSAAGDAYVLSVPLDILDPQLENTARAGDVADIFIDGRAAGRATIGERGALIHLDINVENVADGDGDGLPDMFEDADNDGDYTNDDTDNDGIANYLDDDDDGDGTLTIDEDWNRDGNPLNDDCDQDGIADFLDDDHTCGNPYMVTIVEDFETGDLSKLPWNTDVDGAHAAWEILDDSANAINPDTASAYVLKSFELDHNQTAAVELTMYCETGEISFGYKTSTEDNYDHLNFYIDGVNQNNADVADYHAYWSGNVEYRTQSFAVSRGLHTFTWEFEKDEVDFCDYYPDDPSCADFKDTVWIDNISIPASVDTDGDGMPDSWEAVHGLSVDTADANQDNDADGFLNGVECLYDTDPTDGGNQPLVPLADEDFETGDFSKFAWESSGDGIWTVTGDSTHTGTYAAASADISANQSTALETTRYCDPGSISFWYAVSSEPAIDQLGFYIDGVCKENWSGDQETYGHSENYAVGQSGTYTFTWEYTKNWRGDYGQDRAWLDDISFPGYLDFDNDGLPDSWEVAYGLDPLSNEAEEDNDNDGFSNMQEFLGGSNPVDDQDQPIVSDDID